MPLPEGLQLGRASLGVGVAAVASLAAVAALLWPATPPAPAGAASAGLAWTYDEFGSQALSAEAVAPAPAVAAIDTPIDMEAPAAGPRPAPLSAEESCARLPSPDGAMEDCSVLR
jgi:hypothetical protein